MGQRKHVRRFTLTWKIGSITICTSIELKKHRWAWLRWAILSPLLAAYRPSIGYPWVPPNSLADHQYHTYDIQVCIYIYIYTYYHTISSYIIYIHLSFCLDKPAWVLTVSGNFLSDVWRLMASHLGLGSTGGSPSVLTAWYGALAMGQNGTQSSHLGTQFWLATIHTQSASEWWNTWC